jgi:hypothetical protein
MPADYPNTLRTFISWNTKIPTILNLGSEIEEVNLLGNQYFSGNPSSITINSTRTQGNIQKLHIDGFSATSVILNENAATRVRDLRISTGPSLTDITFQGTTPLRDLYRGVLQYLNILPGSEYDSFLILIDTHHVGLTGTLNIPSNLLGLSGQAAKTSLQSKGWIFQ